SPNCRERTLSPRPTATHDHFHGSLTANVHVVSRPEIRTSPLPMLVILRSPTASPGLTTRAPSTPGKPSTIAVGGEPATIPTNRSWGLGVGGWELAWPCPAWGS